LTNATGVQSQDRSRFGAMAHELHKIDL
jgi:hypothetical protein